MSLPKELEYVPLLSSLGPNVVNTTISVAPTNGAIFQQSDIIQFDLPQRAFLDPGSLFIRYRFNQTSGAGVEIKGVPVYTPFINLQVVLGGSIVENIQGYGQIQNMLVNMTHSAGQKAGLAFPYGLGDYAVTTAATFVGANINGRVCTAAESISMAGPLRCVLSEAERLVPLGLMSGCRVSLTVDSMANIATSAVALAGMTLSNVELVYSQIDFGSATEQMVRSMGDKLYIKSASYASSATTLQNGTSGTADLLYNLRLSSVKSLFTIFGGTSANSLNKLFDSYDPTSSNGDLSYTLGGLQYPSRPVSTLISKAGAFMELKGAIGGQHSASTNNFSITQGEFGVVGNAVTTARLPAKFFFGINTESLSTSNSLLTGISTQDAPIGLRINLGTATQQTYNVSVVALFDSLIEIDTVMRSATVKN
tara:strand:- start:560 stop:1828 length:1269 start_codon:yes stop_codon:yes gene_type:complete